MEIVYRITQNRESNFVKGCLAGPFKSFSSFNDVSLQETERVLENYRINNCLDQLSRLENVFVFPNDNILERAYHWAKKYTSKGALNEQECYLLKLKVEQVQWHDAEYFEQLYFANSNNPSLRRIAKFSENELTNKYWCDSNIDMSKYEVEGLVECAEVMEIIPCLLFSDHIEIKGDQ